MKNRTSYLAGLIIFAFLAVSITGCAGSSNADVDATVQAVVDATQNAEEQIDTAINEAVSATLTAMPTPTLLAVDQLSEEEFAQAVESSADEAVQASEDASVATENASEDGEISEEELEELYYLYYWTLEEVEQALYLADEYYELYAEMLELTIASLEELDTELQAILDTANEVLVVLDDINQTLQQGSEMAQQALDNLELLSQQISTNAANVKNNLPDWKNIRSQELEQLSTQALAVVPNEIAETRVGALAQAREYLEAIQSAIGDGRFSLDELTSISQLGANAAASLSRLGGGDLAGLPDMINRLTGSFAHGQLPDINAGLGSLQNAIPSIR